METIFDYLSNVSHDGVRIALNGLTIGLLLTIVVYVIYRLARPTNAATGYVVWWSVLSLVILCPLAVGSLDSVEGLLFAPSPEAQIANISQQVTIPVADKTTATDKAGLFDEIDAAVAVTALETHPSKFRFFPLSNSATIQMEPRSVKTQTSDWKNVAGGLFVLTLFVGWLVTALVMLVRVGFSIVRVNEIKNDATPADPEEISSFTKMLVRGNGSQAITVGYSDDVEVPMAAGFGYPMILMPEKLRYKLSRGEFRAIILHELAHLQRYDDWSRLLQRVVEAVFFFHPAIHLISGQLDLEREVACDDRVIAMTGQVNEYARCLTKLAQMTSASGTSLIPGVLESRKQIFKRFARLLNRKGNDMTKFSLSRFGTVAVSTIIATLIIGYILPSVSLPVGAVTFSDLSLYVGAVGNEIEDSDKNSDHSNSNRTEYISEHERNRALPKTRLRSTNLDDYFDVAKNNYSDELREFSKSKSRLAELREEGLITSGTYLKELAELTKRVAMLRRSDRSNLGYSYVAVAPSNSVVDLREDRLDTQRELATALAQLVEQRREKTIGAQTYAKEVARLNELTEQLDRTVWTTARKDYSDGYTRGRADASTRISQYALPRLAPPAYSAYESDRALASRKAKSAQQAEELYNQALSSSSSSWTTAPRASSGNGSFRGYTFSGTILDDDDLIDLTDTDFGLDWNSDKNLGRFRGTTIWENENGYNVNWSNDRHRIQVSSDGDIIIGDDDRSIVSITKGGFLGILETTRRVRREIEIESNRKGELTYDYYEDGDAEEFDDDAREWLGDVIEEAINKTGLGAGQRVERIYAKSGLDGVLDLIEDIESDFVRGIYFNHLIEDEDLSSKEWAKMLEAATHIIESDYEMAELLITGAENVEMNDDLIDAYVDAAGSMDSDYETRRVLSTIDFGRKSSPKLVIAVLRIAGEIESDYEKAELLMDMVPLLNGDNDLRRAYVDAIISMESDYEIRRVLSEISFDNDLDATLLKTILSIAVRIGSDYEKAELLIQLADYTQKDPELKEMVLNSIGDIDSDYELSRILKAQRINCSSSPEAFEQIIKLADGMDSDYERTELLLDWTDCVGENPELLTMLLYQVDRIDSDYEKKRLLMGIVRGSSFENNQMIEVLETVEGIDSDYEKTELVKLLIKYSDDDAEVQDAFEEVIESIDSDYDRDRLYGKLYRKFRNSDSNR